jgi:hypothetical protein
LNHRSLDERINESGNLLKVGMIDLIEYMRQLSREIQAIKGEPVKPNQHIAYAMLEYMSWEDKKLVKTVNILAGSQLNKYFKWLDTYCASHKCSQEQALRLIIEGKEQI